MASLLAVLLDVELSLHVVASLPFVGVVLLGVELDPLVVHSFFVMVMVLPGTPVEYWLPVDPLQWSGRVKSS